MTFDDDYAEQRAAFTKTRAALEQQQLDAIQQYDAIRQQHLNALVKQYPARIVKPKELEGPKQLLDEEKALLAAFAANKYYVSGEVPNRGGHWHGMLECHYHLRASCIVMFVDSRLDLLRALWRSASERDEYIVPTEEDLRGHVLRQQYIAIYAECQQQVEASNDDQ